ncbi:cysteine peptidase family C39 domain-containing protein [Candidatus Mycoplasma haematominutum]|uniref:ABC transporter, ATP-binding protein n=1 Tax=Candidatus Mycoplasma haematominutum 'Birmingham 1' TaxID=1116213 RepID=G8C3Y9_9MOLU|nr:cysteine peptidase family C39 domain-containing protein [Candidatus Mycoplasma haematominutum]CCE67037.1 ABC transporter, ATP-binding protein [Candidatus Mycoplasma haematominutum 'Birmingham 1']
MRIYYQESEYDCGVSVTRSLINHFLGKNISRTEIFDQLNISAQGLSIFELEEINKKYGIHLESYRVSLQELQKSDIQEFFVILLYRNHSEHFAIAKKRGKALILYDSTMGKIHMNFQQLAPIFAEKILLIQKIDTNSPAPLINYSESEISILQIHKLWKTTGISLLIFVFIILSFAIHKLIFEDVIQSHHWGNISAFIFLSLFLICIWSLGEYIKDIFYLQDKQWYLKNLYSLFFEKLENKKNYFFSKIGKNQLLLLHQHIQNISLFYGELLSSFISGILISATLTLYLVYLQPWFLVIILVMFALKFANYQFIKKWDSIQFSQTLQNSINVQKILFALNNFLKKEWNLHKFLFLNKSIKNEITAYQLTEKECNYKKILFSKLNFFITHAINIAIYIISCYLYFRNDISLSNMVLAGMIYSQLNIHLDKIISTGIHWEKCMESLKQFKHFLFNDNITEKNKMNISLPAVIALKELNYHNGVKTIFHNLNLEIYPDTFLMGSSGIGKSTLYKLISSKLPNALNSVFFNKIAISDISEKCFNQLIIYQNSQTESKEFNWAELVQYVNSDQIEKIHVLIDKIGISYGQNPATYKLSDGQRQFINLLNLLKFSQKILLLDEVTSHINHEIKQEVFKTIFPILKTRNFVICSDHNTEFSEFFKHQINLNQILEA